MTIDITIGKLERRTLQEAIEQQFDDDYSINFENKVSYIDLLDVKQCPDEYDGCSEADTMCPNSAYRSGSLSGMSDFFRLIPEFIKRARPNSANDRHIALIEPLLELIQNIDDSDFADLQNKKRLLWLKFWTNRAVQLYGKQAAIMFS